MKIRYLSLAARNALIYFVLFILGLSISGYVLFSYSAKEILGLTEENLKHTGELVGLKFETYLDNLETDLDQLAYSPLLEQYMLDPVDENLTQLSNEYAAFLKSKSTYFQVRLIGETTGDELIRIERKEGSIIAAEKDQLQNKSDRDYYKEMLGLPLDSLYFSKIDLNKEHGNISEPITPTLRIAKRLENGLYDGVIVIINVDLSMLFEDMNSLLPKAYELRVFNHEGHYLIHPDKEKEFTFEYGQEQGYSDEFDLSIDSISKQTEIYPTDFAVNGFLSLNYKRNDYMLYGSVSANNYTVFASFYSWRSKVLLVLVGIALLFVMIAFFYMRRQVKELKSITEQITLFSKRPIPHKLPIDRKDEIGELARGFEEMSTQVSESHALIENARKAAEQAFDEKNEFLENMSHEIRNPLQSILGTVQILEQNQVGTHQEPFINSLKFSAMQLRSLVTDVLDYGKIKNNQIELSPEWINLAEFCQDLMKGLNYQAITKRIQVTFSCPDSLNNKNYWLDRTRLYQILNNLLTNGLKFTQSGGNVELRLSVKSDSFECLSFEVIDDGPGISSENIKKIVDRNFTSNYTTGTGLGLTIVQELLRLFDSKLQVESEKNNGSRFFFDLSTKTKNENASTIGNLILTDADKKEIRILIIEDDLELQHWYSYILSGFDLVIISSPSSLPVDLPFDLIITDLQFEDKKMVVDSYQTELSKCLTEKGQIVIVSGFEMVQTENVIYLEKPIKKESVWPIIDQLYIAKSFGIPDFSNIERDYDQVSKLIKNAIHVLVGEWKKDSVKLTEAIANRDKVGYDAINHKIITSVRRLNLKAFELRLLNLSDQLMAKSDTEIASEISLISAIFNHYLNEMEEYYLKLA